ASAPGGQLVLRALQPEPLAVEPGTGLVCLAAEPVARARGVFIALQGRFRPRKPSSQADVVAAGCAHLAALRQDPFQRFAVLVARSLERLERLAGISGLRGELDDLLAAAEPGAQLGGCGCSHAERRDCGRPLASEGRQASVDLRAFACSNV